MADAPRSNADLSPSILDRFVDEARDLIDLASDNLRDDVVGMLQALLTILAEQQQLHLRVSRSIELYMMVK